ncbi:MAG: hypothetical protein ACM3PC_05310 [Deltaproteobacteria bacterium]
MCAALVWSACAGDPPAAAVDVPLTVPAMPPSLVLPPVETSLSELDGSVNLEGSGFNLVGAFRLQQSVGTIEIGGRRLPAVVVAESFTADAILLHQIYALADDAFFVVWTYCSGGAIHTAYVLDSRDGIGRFDGASGTCDEVRRTSPTTVRFPGADLPWPRVHTGFEVKGKSLQLHAAAPGAVLYSGAVQAAIPFAVIDCTQCDAKGGWYELHSILWEPGSGGVTLGIFYLMSRNHSQVLFEYVVDLGSLTLVAGATYAAEWSFTGTVPIALAPPQAR